MAAPRSLPQSRSESRTSKEQGRGVIDQLASEVRTGEAVRRTDGSLPVNAEKQAADSQLWKTGTQTTMVH